MTNKCALRESGFLLQPAGSYLVFSMFRSLKTDKKMLKRLLTLVVPLLGLSLLLSSCASTTEETASEMVSNATIQDFVGEWALHVPNGASWLAVKQETDYLDADLLWYGGSVTPVSHVFYNDGKLTVTRTREVVVDESSERTMQVTGLFTLWKSGEDFYGKAVIPQPDGMGVGTTEFEAVKVPLPGEAPDISAVNYGDPIELFNGTDLSGWSLVNPEHTNGWGVQDGVLVNNPEQTEGEPHIHYGNLRTDDVFDDFNLKLEVNVPAGGNSGVYLRGIYEIQVMDSYGMDLDSHHMGGVYSRVTPATAAERPAGEWQEMDITLYRRHITVVLNGTTIIDDAPVKGVTGGALTADVFAPGPIYLQGDHDAVSYRNVVLTPIVD